MPSLATFKAGLGNTSDHRKTPVLNKNVSERQSPQPQPVANVRGGADMLFYRYEIHAAPAPEISQVAPAFPSVQTTHSHRGAFLKRECSQRAQTCSASSVTFSFSVCVAPTIAPAGTGAVHAPSLALRHKRLPDAEVSLRGRTAVPKRYVASKLGATRREHNDLQNLEGGNHYEFTSA